VKWNERAANSVCSLSRLRHSVPSPACGGGKGRGHAEKEGARNKTDARKLTPSPTLPRKREREQTEFAAPTDSTSRERTESA